MNRYARWAVAALVLLTVACSRNANRELATGDAAMEEPPPLSGIQYVMAAKLAHAEAVVEGIVRADFPLVRSNAQELAALSRDSQWLVHDTVTYVLFSEQFREVATQMATNAGRNDLDAVTADYVELIHTCVACHTYLRRERLTKDFPQRISMLRHLDSSEG